MSYIGRPRPRALIGGRNLLSLYNMGVSIDVPIGCVVSQLWEYLCKVMLIKNRENEKSKGNCW